MRTAQQRTSVRLPLALTALALAGLAAWASRPEAPLRVTIDKPDPSKPLRVATGTTILVDGAVAPHDGFYNRPFMIILVLFKKTDAPGDLGRVFHGNSMATMDNATGRFSGAVIPPSTFKGDDLFLGVIVANHVGRQVRSPDGSNVHAEIPVIIE